MPAPSTKCVVEKIGPEKMKSIASPANCECVRSAISRYINA
jgi:hypothetical protein